MATVGKYTEKKEQASRQKSCVKMGKMFYKYYSVDVFRMSRFPENVEINLKDFLHVTEEINNNPEPYPDQWIPVDKYYQFVDQTDGVLCIKISSKYEYCPKDPQQKHISFLTPNSYKLKADKLRLREKREINWLSVISILISLSAMVITILNYLDRKDEVAIANREMVSAKSPVWIVEYDSKMNFLRFKSPSPDIQLQEGVVKFSPEARESSQSLYMPDMRLDLGKFILLAQTDYATFPRGKYQQIFGNRKVFQSFAVGVKYTYKGELMHKGAIYRLFYDGIIPTINDRNKKPEIKIRGVTFVRFIREDETLTTGLNNVNNNETTSHPDWIKLLSDGKS